MALELNRFTKPDAGMFVVGLLIPKIVKFVRKRRAVNWVPLSLFNRLRSVESCIEEFFNQPENAAAKKALKATMYANNYGLLAKRVMKYV